MQEHFSPSEEDADPDLEQKLPFEIAFQTS